MVIISLAMAVNRLRSHKKRITDNITTGISETEMPVFMLMEPN